MHGVESLVSNLDPGKAGGPDGLPIQFLKEMAMDLSPSSFKLHYTEESFQMTEKSLNCTNL